MSELTEFEESLRKWDFILDGMLPGNGSNFMAEYLNKSYPERRKTRMRLNL